MDLIQSILVATSNIDKHYFALPVAGVKKPLLRERVYCYELYHQLRQVLSDETQLVLTAETDKRGNPTFTDGHPIPDFIFHRPGDHQENSAVVEVECRVSRRHLRKEFRTFKCLQAKRYRQFILLLFGIRKVPWRVLAELAREVDINLNEIVVLLHTEPGVKATRQKAPNVALEPPD